MKKETAYQRRGCSIFCKILHSLLLVLLAEVLLLIFAISTSRVTSQLNENARIFSTSRWRTAPITCART